MKVVRIGDYRVSYDIEQFRIFPKDAQGKSRPVTRINQFLYITNRHGTLTFKRYLHMKSWHWRDSREPKPVYEIDVINEVARILFDGDKDRARDLLVAFVTGGSLAQFATGALVA
jgi:hypothetical protein